MDIVIKIVGVIGGIITVLASVGILLGVKDFRSGIVNENPTKTDKGIEAIVLGGVVAVIAGSVTAYVIASLNGITF